MCYEMPSNCVSSGWSDRLDSVSWNRTRYALLQCRQDWCRLSDHSFHCWYPSIRIPGWAAFACLVVVVLFSPWPVDSHMHWKVSVLVPLGLGLRLELRR